MVSRNPDVATFGIRFAPELNRNQIEDILKDSCCHVKVHNVRVGSIGSVDFAMAVVDICLCHQDALRNDNRVLYWEQMTDLTPRAACDSAECGNC